MKNHVDAGTRDNLHHDNRKDFRPQGNRHELLYIYVPHMYDNQMS